MRIVAINRLKDATSISEMCHASSTPICVVKHGYGDMVIMSMESYERREERIFLKDLKRGIYFFRALDGDTVMGELEVQ